MIPENIMGRFSIRHSANGTIELLEDGRCWMSDNKNDKATQQPLIEPCSGNVLVGGLGIGYIVERLAEKPEVRSVVVVEKSPEVVELVWGHLDTKGKAVVVCCDIFNYLSLRREGFDFICLDVWKDESKEEYKNVLLPLRKLAEKSVSPENVLCWQENEMRKKWHNSQ